MMENVGRMWAPVRSDHVMSATARGQINTTLWQLIQRLIEDAVFIFPTLIPFLFFHVSCLSLCRVVSVSRFKMRASTVVFAVAGAGICAAEIASSGLVEFRYCPASKHEAEEVRSCSRNPILGNSPSWNIDASVCCKAARYVNDCALSTGYR
jgi:hypothetical protein